MASRRRRRKHPVIGRVPGQKGRVVIEPSQLVIDREADKVIVHDQQGTQTHRVPGREHHVHVHSGGQPRPERPILNFENMNQELVERFEKHCANHAVNLGLGGEKERKIKGHIRKATYQPRFRGEQGLVRDIASVKKIIMDEWKGIHPLTALGALTSTRNTVKKGANKGANIGIIGYRKARREIATARKLREKYAPEFNQLFEQYKAETEQALFNLMDAFEAGEINWDNYNRYMGNYKKALKKAEDKFVVGRMKLMDAHNKEWTA